VASRIGLNDFKASNGWLDKFNKDYEINYNTYSGDSADVCQTNVDEWKAKISQLVEGFKPEDVFNFDEIGLFWKLFPKKSYLIKGAQYVGGKKCKQRISLGFCCSVTGEKLKPVVIGKFLGTSKHF